jgi:putative FmdB family regulatory protein
MPIYGYRCLDCGSWDQRVAGLDDEAAMCTKCEGLMLRVADNILRPYFEDVHNLLEEMVAVGELEAGRCYVAAGKSD